MPRLNGLERRSLLATGDAEIAKNEDDEDLIPGAIHYWELAVGAGFESGAQAAAPRARQAFDCSHRAFVSAACARGQLRVRLARNFRLCHARPP